MPKYVIERGLPGAGTLGPDKLAAIAQRSNEVLSTLDGRAQWIHSYVTDDKLFCVYIAESPDALREHAEMGPFPCDAIYEVHTMFDPVTAET